MSLLDWIPPLRTLPFRRTRRRWATEGRAHIELREVPPDRYQPFADRLEDELAAVEGVAWAQVNPHLWRVVVAHDAGLDHGHLEEIVVRLEEEAGLAHYPFPSGRTDHPGDAEPILHDFIGLGGDVVGLGLGLIGRAARIRPLPIEIDVAAFVSVIEGAPRVRHIVERRVGRRTADLALTLTSAVAHGLAQGPLGPVIDIAHRTSIYGELIARRRVWERREPDLCAKPVDGGIEPPPGGERPVPVPAGPVETYADRAWFGSLAAFGIGLAITRRMERAVAALYAGLPKAARLGREAFAAQLGRGLSGRGVVPLEPRVLRLLDRVDCLVVTDDVVLADDDAGRAVLRPGADVLLSAARRAELHTVLGTIAATDTSHLPIDETVPPDDVALVEAVRHLQAAGKVVCVVTAGASPALAAADCGVGLYRPGEPPPWGAHLLCTEDLADAVLVVSAVADARDVSRQSVALAAVGAGAGLVLAFGGLVPGTTQRATTAVNVAAAMAIANGGRRGAGIARRQVPITYDPTPWHELEIDEVFARLGSSARGLSAEEAAQRRTEPDRPPPPPLRFARAVVDELANPLTPVLGGGAALSAAAGSLADSTMVGGVMGLNALVGGVQRLRADRAIDRLVRRERRSVTVVRDDDDVAAPLEDLVPGDVIRLRAGDTVPADCRLLANGKVEVDESSLTGESIPVVKSSEPSSAVLVAERTSMLYEGTSVAAGDPLAVIVAVGDATEARRSIMLGTKPPESGVEVRLRRLTALTIPVSLASGAAVVGIGMLRGRSLRQTLGAGVTLAVAAVPEGLPLLATVAQLGAARRLTRRGALVRNPRAIEALGRVDVVCADKTGTLTV
ncbi:MAG TPA: HAD-IC family P-type ATPase, partial [Acidimicrobiia bacterium]